MAEYGQDAEMVELFHTVGRIMKMSASSTVTGMRRAANNATHSLLRPVTALRGGGSSAVSEANGDATRQVLATQLILMRTEAMW